MIGMVNNKLLEGIGRDGIGKEGIGTERKGMDIMEVNVYEERN